MTDLHSILNADQRVELGGYFIQKQDYATALAFFESALDADRYNLNAMCNGAYMLLKMRDMKRAEEWVRRALALAPEHAHGLGIYAMIEQEMLEFKCARALFEHSLRNDPGNVTTLLNYGYMLQLVGDYRKALEVYTKARDINVMDISTRFQRALCLLTIADTPEEWKEAWSEYELRHFLARTGPMNGKPMYTGEKVPCASKLVIFSEQGIGDTVMAARYIRYLKKCGLFSEVHLLCDKSWCKMMERIDGVDMVVSDLTEIKEWDYWVPALSLFRSENFPGFQPLNAPYIKHQPRDQRLPGNKRIGLCWQGNPAHQNDRWRSIGPDKFRIFGKIPDATFYSLHTKEVSDLRPSFVRDCKIETLEGLCDVIHDMDLIVTVDTSILHIAGAMGVPTCALLPSNPDFRWQSKGERTPLYPSVVLFRATEPLQWEPVLEAVADVVRDFQIA